MVMPEILSSVREGWSYALVVALTTVALALSIVRVARRTRLAKWTVDVSLFAMAGLALLPVIRGRYRSCFGNPELDREMQSRCCCASVVGALFASSRCAGQGRDRRGGAADIATAWASLKRPTQA